MISPGGAYFWQWLSGESLLTSLKGACPLPPEMKPSTALKKNLDAVKKAVVARRACNARVFGSALSGTDKDGSDLDLLVDTLPGATLFELGGLQVDLEEILGVPVDLLTPGDLPAKFRDKILHEAKEI